MALPCETWCAHYTPRMPLRCSRLLVARHIIFDGPILSPLPPGEGQGEEFLAQAIIILSHR